MNPLHARSLASQLNLREAQVIATIALLDDDATIPFISRYRKEVTENLDEVEITAIRDGIELLRELDKRRVAILKSLTELEKLTPELEHALLTATTLAEIEDIYLPYKPKKKTKASIAKERGLEPLAQLLFKQDPSITPRTEATRYINPEKSIASLEDALQGARDIIAEWINEDAEIRGTLRKLFYEKATVVSKVLKDKEEIGQKFRDYFKWEESLATIPSHRLLALLRGANESILKISLSAVATASLDLLTKTFIQNSSLSAGEVTLALEDSFKRLIFPSLETEMLHMAKDKADEQAIRVFAENLRELLLAPPLGQKRVLALDPGFRTGCKVVCLDAQGKLLVNHVVYPTEPLKQIEKAGKEIKALVEKFSIEAIAIGNGTACRETESFVQGLQLSIPVVMVNESGASIYSASAVARDEFPDHDVTVRGAVSIGRRLLDPLAELVKIDPKAIGVGQYQHDQKLKQSLDDVVMSCVNAVGVDVNTASKEILTYVSGLGPKLAQNIVTFRNENGPFVSRTALKKVPKLGFKAFEQSAGFLRIPNAKNPLDSSAVHPESYPIVETIAKDLKTTVVALIRNQDLIAQIQIASYMTDTVGLLTLQDIVQELTKPGRDPRKQFEVFSFAEDIHTLNDLEQGLELPGIITNVTNFGAFVDIGVHQDGLVHISELADTFISDPTEYVKVGQKVKVRVLEVDIARKRVSLSMKGTPSDKIPTLQQQDQQKRKEEIETVSSGIPTEWQRKLAELKKSM